MMNVTTIRQWRCFAVLGLLACQPVRAAIDLNTNGMSDVWELVYDAGSLAPGDDTDGDGRSNLSESLAGSNPFSTGSVVRVTAADVAGPDGALQWPTLVGKRYHVRSSTNLTTVAWTQEGGAWPGTGSNLSAAVTVGGAPTFFLIEVQDVDSDSDGVSNWEELQVGFDPQNASTDGVTNDLAAIAAALVAPNVVTVTARDAYAGEEGPVPGAFQVTRAGNLNPVTVGYALGGQATAGSDFAALPGSIALPIGARSAIITVNPLADAVVESGELVTLALEPDVAYAVGDPSVAHVLISDPATPSGTGLQAQYFDNASSTYGNAANFSGLQVTRVDPTVNFIWGAGRPNTLVSNNGFSARWDAVLVPAVSGTYAFDLLADDGARLFVTNDLLIDAWAAGAAASTPLESAPVTLDAGSNYPIRVEYYENTNAALVRLRWRLPGGTRFDSISTNAVLTPALVTNRWVATYFNNTNLSGAPVSSGLESTINDDWGTGTPDTSVAVDTFSVRWTGQVQPQHSETYTFVARTADGVKLWVNGQLIVDAWANQGAADRIGTIALQAGVRYDLKMEYFENTSAASAQLSWYSPSQAKQIIPQNRLYPTNAAPAAVTSPRTAVALLGGPFLYKVSGSNLPLTLSVTGLPAGLSFDPATGLITGVPTEAGTFAVVLGVVNAMGTGQELLELTVLAPGGTITREYWMGIGGDSVTNIPLTTAPGGTNLLASLQGPADWGDDFGARIRGTLTAPLTGNYRFWIASDGASELWIATDDEPVNRVRRAWVTNATAAAQWNAEPNQRSPLLRLVAGQPYDIEILHKEASGADHVAVGWALPGESNDVPSGIVPGYVLAPYTAPVPEVGEDTLYVAALTPQAGAMTTGSGFTTLRVNADETAAVLVMNYGNLTTPFTAAHVHDAAHGGAIIFDLDDAPLIDGAYHWTFEPTGALTVADILHAIKNGNAYLNVHSSRYPAGEIRGTYALAAGSQTFSPPPPPPALPGGLPTAQEAARFLAQATFGPTSNAIAEVQASGYAAWLDQQFDLPPSQHLPLVDAFYAANTNADATANTTFNAWWERAVTAPDQLRQRVAFALSEILVVSREDADLEVQPVGLSAYYDLLLTNAFGNFRQLLEEATLSPAMGDYLDMRRNDKPDQVTGRYPNENYAREVLQLFSIGLRKLHPDGTLKISSEGLPIPTYSQDEIVGFAHTFTGWTYFSTNQNWSAGANFRLPMTWVASHHDTGEKRVLDNVVLAAGQSAAADLDQALDNIFENPNVGPFLCRILIQRLVCSNPSPAYVYRVTRAFEDNGAGVRGDLRAVVRAILLDYEARSASFLAAQGYGKQREPVLRVSTIVRAFGGGSTNGFTMNGTDFDLQQTPIAAPTVFNFYEPDYIAPGDLAGAGLFAPEFQITSETSVIRSHNFLRSGLFSARGYKNTLYLDLSAQQALAGNVPELVEQLNQLLLAGQMSVGLRGVVTNYVNTISAAQTLDRARSAIHLVVTSPEFSIQK